MTTASPLEILYTLLALAGVLAGVKAAWEAGWDWRAATALDSATIVRGVGRWQVLQWTGVAVSEVCLLIVGLRALALPTPAAQSEDNLVSSLALLGAALIWMLIPMGYLVHRWLILRGAPPVAPEPEAG